MCFTVAGHREMHEKPEPLNESNHLHCELSVVPGIVIALWVECYSKTAVVVN